LGRNVPRYPNAIMKNANAWMYRNMKK
jgi:hypothetical protein